MVEGALSQFFDNPALSDIIFEVQEEQIHVIKIMLQGLCPEIMPLIDAAEPPVKGSKQIVKVVGYSPQAFRAFLRFLYIKEIAFTLDICFQVHKLSLQYDKPELTQECLAYIKSQFSVNHIVAIYEKCIEYNIPNLPLEIENNWFKTQAEEILKVEYIVDCSPNTLSRLIRMGFPTMSPINIFNLAQEWNKAGISSGKVEREFFNNEILPFIKLEEMSLKDLTKIVRPSGCLSDDTFLSLAINSVINSENLEIEELKRENTRMKEYIGTKEEELNKKLEEVNDRQYRKLEEVKDIQNRKLEEVKERQIMKEDEANRKFEEVKERQVRDAAKIDELESIINVRTSYFYLLI